jgi:nucleoid-associated protein YgaU
MISKYQYWFTFDNEKERLRLPVLPEEFSVSIGSKNESVDVAGLGETTIKQDRPAITFSFSSIFPASEFPGVEYEDFPPPSTCIETLIRWKESEYPIHFIVTGTKINIFVTIESLEYKEIGGDVGTLHYSITLKEFRPIQVNQIKVNTSTGTAIVRNETKRTDNRVQSKLYTVAPGDYLFKIAKKTLSDPSKWKEIASINGLKAPYTIYPNQKLKLPTDIG